MLQRVILWCDADCRGAMTRRTSSAKTRVVVAVGRRTAVTQKCLYSAGASLSSSMADTHFS